MNIYRTNTSYGKKLKCPKCHSKDMFSIDFDEKNLIWKPNGHKYKIGNKIVEAVDPYPIKAKCEKCEHVFIINHNEPKERVEFT